MNDYPRLETARLLLRAFTLEDAPDVHKLVGAREIADTTLNIPHPYEEGMAEEWISTHAERFEKGQATHFAITLRVDNSLAGGIGLHINPRFDRGEIGYWVAVHLWNQGICTEAAGEVLRYAFEELGLNRVQATHFSRNPASGRVMQKIGMLHEGTLRQYVRKLDVYEDLEMYSILRQEWQ